MFGPIRTAQQSFVLAYLDCLLWQSCDDDGQSLTDAYNLSDLAPGERARAEKDAIEFYDAHSDKWTDNDRAGHDFALSRNGHGTGFFDGDDDDYHGNQETLQDATRAYGEASFYVGDDESLYYVKG